MKKLLLLMVVLIAVTGVRAQSDVFAPGGKAIKGYDAVAFFTESKPVEGRDSLAYTWQKATWLFSSRSNLDLFKASPEKYAPQYGGYCAYGLSMGHKSPTETGTWTVKNDKLYFNYNKDIQKIWLNKQDSLIQKADEKWPALKDKN